MTPEQERELQILQVICTITIFVNPQILTREQLVEQTIRESKKRARLVTEKEVELVLCKSVQCIALRKSEWS